MALGGNEAVPKPLTKLTKAGKAYSRPPDVESQLSELLRESEREQLTRARLTDSRARQFVLDECLVYLVREAGLGDDPERYNRWVGVLLNRITGSIARKLRELGVAREDVDDIHQEVVLTMMKSILGGAKGEYYQVHFRSALNRQLLKSYDKYARARRRTTRERSLDEMVRSDDGDDGGGAYTFGETLASAEDMAAEVEHRLLETERRQLARDALQAITNPDHRKAFVLYHLEEWQIESTDPEAPTLSKLFDRTPRMIRNWIRTAERQLAEWRTAQGA